ncbi:hypothetical protein ACP70R_014621 [Stipagrostis hirtigluma subsp. patula]
MAIDQINSSSLAPIEQAKLLEPERMDSIHDELHALERMLEGSGKPSKLSLSVLKYITDNFCEERKIGDGGCGEVYKGILLNWTTVAVKKLFNRHTIDDKQFIQEVLSMMMIEHPNIVRLLGYCSHTEQNAMDIKGKFVMADIRERLLCFEYINNGSLDNYLTDELRGLDWFTRYKIIKGICEGLHHLHKEKQIIHMDLKPANILLDDHMVPKIADFGLSRLGEISHTSNNYRLLSPRYCAPEYQHHGKMSLRSDIYSLGVILIELVTGSKEEPDTTNVLRRWRHRWSKSSEHTPWEYKQVTKCIELALRCIDKDPLERPFIWDIIDALNQTENANSNECTADQIKTSCLEDMLGIEPLELHFPFEPNKQISCSLQLTNDTDDYFAFRIEAMNPLQYRIDPIKDVVPPRSKCSVTVMTQTPKQAPNRKHCKEELSVQSTRVDESLKAISRSKRCLEAMGRTKDVFSEKTQRVIDKVNLTVVFDTPPLSVERMLMDEVSPKHQGTGEVSKGPRVVSLWPSLRQLVRRRQIKKRSGIPKHEEEAPPAPQPKAPSAPQRKIPSTPLPQHALSPMGAACSRMDLQSIHQILVYAHYTADPGLDREPTFQEWTQQVRDALDARKRGDFAFRDKEFRAAIEIYTAYMLQATEVTWLLSPSAYARRSLCHIMCNQPDDALRDAVDAEHLLPDWPTALYLQAVALSELNMLRDATEVLNEALELEEKQLRDKEMRKKDEENGRLREEKWQEINEEIKKGSYYKSNKFWPLRFKGFH